MLGANNICLMQNLSSLNMQPIKVSAEEKY